MLHEFGVGRSFILGDDGTAAYSLVENSSRERGCECVRYAEKWLIGTETWCHAGF